MNVGSWTRQARHRAKKHGCYVSLETEQVAAIVKEALGCTYCGGLGTQVLDNPFPLSGGAPCVPANVVVCCKGCKDRKGNIDLVAFNEEGHMPDGSSRLVNVIKAMLARAGGPELKKHIKASMVID